jgi:hypothetical protein
MLSVTDLQEGDKVCFALGSVYLPSSQEAVALLGPADQILGTIMNFSESERGQRDFAVVSLAGSSKVVVPLDGLARVAISGQTD